MKIILLTVISFLIASGAYADCVCTDEKEAKAELQKVEMEIVAQIYNTKIMQQAEIKSLESKLAQVQTAVSSIKDAKNEVVIEAIKDEDGKVIIDSAPYGK